MELEVKRSKLIAFDVDKTLIHLNGYDNVWQILNSFFKVDNKTVANMYNRFKRGEISYKDWAREAFEQYLKKNPTKDDFYKILKLTKLMPGSLQTIKYLKEKGKKLAIISGSLDILIKKFQYYNMFDYYLINKVIFDKRGYVSKFIPTPYGSGKYKAMGLITIAEHEGISLNECVFVGDGENDLHVMKISGSCIVFNPSSNFYEKIKKRNLKVVYSQNLFQIIPYIN